MRAERMERDSMGEVKVPGDAYWGAQTQRAIRNFPISGIRFPAVFIRSIAMIKRACAIVNVDLGKLNSNFGGAIGRACDEIMSGEMDDQFPLDVFQTGSGTSTNMNVNEVIATRANEIVTGERRTTDPIHPNDHVNMGQSSNDVIPTAIHVSAYLQTKESLLPSLDQLHKAIEEKRMSYVATIKTGRTHLMDALPLTLAQEMSGWASQVAHTIVRIEQTLPRLAELAIGGTAVGTGVNAPADFGSRIAGELSRVTRYEFKEAANHFEAQSAQDAVTELSAQLKVYATILIKVSNDLRWMNSGPIAGLHEIEIPAVQPGSSIMPGKVNPVIPEAARMVAVQVIGFDTAIAIANAMGEFQLNVMLPVFAHNILQAITLLANVSRLMAEDVINGFTVNEKMVKELALRGPMIATVLSPLLGYDKAAEVTKRALEEKKSVKQLILEMGLLSPDEAERILDAASLTRAK